MRVIIENQLYFVLDFFSKMAKLLVIHGPNLNLLGTREPEIYGSTTLSQINDQLIAKAKKLGHELDCFQANGEQPIIEKIHQAKAEQVEFLIINPAAFTHTSVAIRDAISGVDLPFVEVHLSNVHSRESFRHHSYFSDLAIGVICGLGTLGYEYALDFASQHLTNKN